MYIYYIPYTTLYIRVTYILNHHFCFKIIYLYSHLVTLYTYIHYTVNIHGAGRNARVYLPKTPKKGPFGPVGNAGENYTHKHTYISTYIYTYKHIHAHIYTHIYLTCLIVY
jgi:hypothetical protein